ncbi:hypothetical protein K1T71_006917 [Dendrolimus kikuchii]|uniref:Uncharacterized protein n=1 Tax=Dendrolimus kikuchii TaxID=765133 RepID=A0ACC1D008_9NEOP|nr:hypothetical protein K1T71_006917 [Dendrolimus kikuchii]
MKRLAATIETLNYDKEILNLDKYGPIEADITIIAIQVHTSILRLQYLIASLEQVPYIDSVLIIFSHSYYHEDINDLIRSITFCRVLQVFYPHSLQLNPHKFPGIDPDDCGNKTQREAKIFCTDRDATITEHKQHWWWKANLIFNSLPWSTSYVGTVLFLEEDDYVLPDLLHMLRYSQELMISMPEVEIISLGGLYLKNRQYDLLTVDAWKPPYHKGLAFNKSAWRRMSQLSSYFCVYDDSSWGYSLLHLFEHIQKGRIDMVTCMVPRVISTGRFESGREAMEVIETRLMNAGLFPKDIKAVMLFDEEGRVTKKMKAPPHGNGGWGDVRDHLLCLDPQMVTSTKTTDEDSTITVPVFS